MHPDKMDPQAPSTQSPSNDKGAAPILISPTRGATGQDSSLEKNANRVVIQEGNHDEDPVSTVPQVGKARRRVIMFSLSLALFLSALDVTIVATALPTIAMKVGVSGAGYAWVGSSYALSSTASVPIWAEMSNVFGRKPTIMCANVAFMGGSLLAGLANSVAVLIGGRVLQGLGGGGCTILVTIIISDMFELKDRAKYYGMTGIVWAIASSTGPVLGGVFTQTIGWRWCFFINLPLCGISLINLFFSLKISSPKQPIFAQLKALDWVGFMLVIGGTVCFLIGLEMGSSGAHKWHSGMVIGLLVAGLLILGLFAFWEAKYASKPIIPGRIFAKRTNCASILLMCTHSLVFISYDYFLPLYFQLSLGMKPIVSGVSLFALVVPLSISTVGTGRFVQHTRNYSWPIWLGSCVMTLGTGLLIELGPRIDWAQIIIFQTIIGLGAGGLFQAPMISLQSHVAQHDVAASASASTFLKNICTSASIVMGTVLLQKGLGGGLIVPHITGDAPTASAAERMSPGDYVSALKIMWIFYTVVCSSMMLTGMFIKKMPQKDSGREDQS